MTDAEDKRMAHELSGEEPAESPNRLFTRRTLYQAIGYGLVGVYEWMTGYLLFMAVPLPQFWAFTVQSLGIGATAFVLRKYAVFRA